MSIMLAAAGCMAAASGESFSMTYGEEAAAGYTGYSDGTATDTSFGSISPSSLNGQTVRAVITVSSTDRFIIAIAGNLAQDFFTRVLCELGSFNSADASLTYFSGDDYTRWLWSQGSSNLFPSSGGGGVTFFE